MSHAKKHPVTDVGTVNHSVGTMLDGDVLRREGAALVGRAAANTGTGSTIALRTAGGQVVIADALNANEAASLGQVQTLISTSILWKNPAAVLKMVDDSNMGGVTPAGVVGRAYVVNNWGPGYVNGDIVECTSVSPDVFTVIVTNAGGKVPVNTRIVVIGPVGSGLGAGSFTGKEAQIGTADGLGGWTWSVPADGWALLINGEASVYENACYTFDTNAWIQFIAAAVNHNLLPGLQGGDIGAGEMYHLDSSQYAEVGKLRPTFALAGTEPTKNDMTTTGAYGPDDRGMAVGTDGSIWLCYYDGSNGYAVQLGQTL